jgi:hypothetical protein
MPYHSHMNHYLAVLNGEKGGNWTEYAVVPAHRLIPVPNDLSDAQVASFFINPASAIAMVRHVLAVPRGEWLLQSAAGSELGHMIIKLARHDGIHTINIVRRRASGFCCKKGAALVERVRKGSRGWLAWMGCFGLRRLFQHRRQIFSSEPHKPDGYLYWLLSTTATLMWYNGRETSTGGRDGSVSLNRRSAQLGRSVRRSARPFSAVL